MSDALNYLAQARPEAMTAYMKFLKEAGKGLDPKTRFLISVITKIATQTENGFKQYLKRAMESGATANEIIDAILQAFPALGLTKIVWATNILLEMDLPEFRPENLNVEKSWHEVKAVSDIPAGQVTYCDVEGRSLFVYHEGGDYKVYDSHCPHQTTNIPHLALEGMKLTCPKHKWAFDIKTGECVEVGNRPLTHFENKVEGGKLYAFW